MIDLLDEREGKIPNRNGMTPILIAALNGRLECVKLLMHHIDEVDNDGDNALTLAALKGHVEIVQFVKSHLIKRTNKNKLTALMFAAANNHKECVSLLLEECGMLQCDGYTALALAAQRGLIDIYPILEHQERNIMICGNVTLF